MSQTVLITLDDDRFISIQSSALAELPAGHPRLPDALMHMLDRNFAMAGARFARQAADGQVVLRADMRLDGRISEAEVLRAVEDLLLLADRETPRLREVIAGDRD